MDPQISLSQRAFYVGLIIMLASGIASAAAWSDFGQALSLIALAGAMLAWAARTWHNHLLRSFRQRNANTCSHL
ncbi:MAG TPA: hypothetical protein PKG54_18535 [Phycisphaerae bacterium]|nr:hypothetical protein [Phycisphaerae bacterium]HOB76511.1 hypothetical protein [Phycisphaerae bacterium]HOJ56065.1 hypothetical protein [Phycisphaerae bacterium]HOL28305.1 hypothetical protein [Phycisphaerae bacterium]HPP22779.1 hypothetical protein [Phycisphaerae bacterium]